MITEAIQVKSRKNIQRGIRRWARQMIIMLVFFGAVLFLSAGTLNWVGGWVFLGMNFLTQLLSAILLIPRQGEMLADRSKVREGTKGWDRILAPAIVIVGTLALIITAGMDARFNWSEPVNSILWAIAVAFAFASQMFVLWAMASNPYFASTVRIQADRGQTAVQQGPYQLVRHPGYAGSLIFTLFIPLVLGSWAAYLPALFTIILTFLRTYLEDRTLQNELPGYTNYAARIRYRLLPGIW